MAQHRILLVDDEEDLTDSLVRRLSKALPDLEFVGETSGEAALRHVAERSIDVLVTDIRMPGIGGVELLLRSRALVPGLKCVVMTAYSTEQVRSEVLRHDWVSYIEKPFELQSLVFLLEELLNETPVSGFKGAMQLETLPDLLQLFIMGHTTGALHVWHRGNAGAVWFDRGEITHAAAKGASGVPAFNEIVTWAAGDFSVERDCNAPERTIFDSPTALLMEAYRVLDESRRPLSPETMRAGTGSTLKPAADLLESREPGLDNEQEVTLTAARPMLGPPVAATSREAASGKAITASSNDESRERSMSKLDNACKEVVNRVEGAVACSVVDLDTGKIIGIFNAALSMPSPNESLAAVTMDMFRGPNVTRIAELARAQRSLNENGEHSIQEIQITSSHSLHFAKAIRDGKAVILLITRKTINVGMGWAQLKALIPALEPLVP